MMTLLASLRLLVRSLARAPSFTLTVLLTLGIGFGATVAVFSVVNSVLLKPLPYPDADELVAVWHVAPGAPGVTDAAGGLRPSPSMYFTYSEESRAFQSVGLWQGGSATVTGVAEPEQVGIATVTAGVLETLRVPPLLGRWFTAEDQVPGGPNRVLLSYEYWQARFGGDAAVTGRSITINATPWEIVGVMPAGFRVVDANPGLILPARFDRSRLDGPPFCCRMIARLAPGATVDEGNADVERMLPIWLETFAGPQGAAVFRDTWRIGPALRPLKQEVVGSVGNVLWVVLGTVGLVLLIACANALNLLLVRAETREREFAVRTALGAGAWRLTRWLLLESLALGLLGGALGLVVAEATLQFLVALAPALPRLNEIALDARSVALCLALSVIAGALLGTIPALKVAGRRVADGLRSGSRGASSGRRQYRTQNVLVVAQVALALVLLVSSGLMIRTFQALLAVEPGLTDPATLQTVRLSIPPAVEADPDRLLRMQNDIVDAFAALPGVESAAFISAMPLENRDGDWDSLRVEGAVEPQDPSAWPVRRFKYLSPGLLDTAGTRLVAGRDIEWTDLYDDRRVGLISENLARELFGTPEAALGRRIGAGRSTTFREIVGVVENISDIGLGEPAPAIAYWPTLMTDFYGFQPRTFQRSVTFVVRSPLAGTDTLVRQMQRAVASVNPGLPLAGVQTMQEIYDASLARQSFTLVTLVTAGAVALALGLVGLYGVLAYVIAQRRREIAIRLALGSQQDEVTRRFVRHGLGLAGIGVVLGLGAAIGVTRLMESLLFGVRPLDLTTYVVVAASLTAIAALASWLPARRAARVDPASVLQAE
jgi:predicted permease